MSDDALKEPRPACWPFDPNPPKPAKSDNGWIRCHVCEQVQPVAGHECADRDAFVHVETRTPTEIAADRASTTMLVEMFDALKAENRALRDQLDAIREGLDEWAPVGDETLARVVIRLRNAYEASALAAYDRAP